MVSPDTHPRFAAKQVELIRAMEPGRKADLTAAFSWDLITASRRLIADQHPEWSDQEVKLHWAEIHYGADLANRVRDFLRRPSPASDVE